MTGIPGAEFAPILTRTIIDLGPEGSEYQIEREIRWRADVTDPDDQRAIWTRAALALGATEEEAAVARIDRGLTGSWWLYTTAAFDRTGHAYPPSMTGMFATDLHILNRAEATAALCRAVWGPR